MIHFFDQPVSHIALPERFTYPFNYTPHPLCVLAASMLLSLISMLANVTFLVVGGLSHGFLATEVEMQACAASLIMTFAMMYQTFFILALLTTIFEYKHIHCAQKWRLVTNLFTFPIFMFSYIPITVAALFLKVDWVPTQHAVNVTLDEVMQGAK